MRSCIIGFFIVSLLLLPYAEENKTDTVSTGSKEFTTVTAKKFTFSYRIEKENLVAKVSCPTKGWVAVGFNPIKMMKGANLIIGTFKDGQGVAYDHCGITVVGHKPDTLIGGTNDLLEYSCTEEKGVTTLSFTIPLDSGDEKDSVLKQGEETKVIFAAGKKDNLKTKHSIVAKTKVVF